MDTMYSFWDNIPNIQTAASLICYVDLKITQVAITQAVQHLCIMFTTKTMHKIITRTYISVGLLHQGQLLSLPC